MKETLEKKKANTNSLLILSMGYVFLMTTIYGYVNYTQPYDFDPVRYLTFWDFALWGSLYLPLLVFPIFAKWEVKELGFSINPYLILASLFLGGICAPITRNVTWYGAFAEAFARTGEEFFFRGFLFLLLMRIFEKKRRPWIWAVSGSSVAFMLIHTQMFQPSFFAGDTTPLAFAMIQRFLTVFLLAAVFALIRYWTKSILPSAIAHSWEKGGIVTLPFVLVIYASITYWAYIRKENILSGFEQRSQAIG